MKKSILLSCEHAGNWVPQKFKYLFKNADELLKSHKGFDIGALNIAKYLTLHLHIPLYYSRVSRLLIEQNRSITNKNIFSKYSHDLTNECKHFLLDKYYVPFHKDVISFIQNEITKSKSVLHFSIHTFTPVMDGVKRNCDIGLLYDPKRLFEKDIVHRMYANLHSLLPNLNIRLNYPYKGTADGHTTSLRKLFNDNSYAGVEIEINQKFCNEASSDLQEIKIALIKVIKTL